MLRATAYVKNGPTAVALSGPTRVTVIGATTSQDLLLSSPVYPAVYQLREEWAENDASLVYRIVAVRAWVTKGGNGDA